MANGLTNESEIIPDRRAPQRPGQIPPDLQRLILGNARREDRR